VYRGGRAPSSPRLNAHLLLAAGGSEHAPTGDSTPSHRQQPVSLLPAADKPAADRKPSDDSVLRDAE